MSKQTKKNYSPTLQLPRTSFSMRANLLQAEPRHQERWAGLDLYQQTRRLAHPKGRFILHDGPPYANGPIHMGHLLNKILKDLVVRCRIMAGYDVEFIPGWDCHGLPIEHMVAKKLGARVHELGTMAIRQKCQEYAQRFVELQSQQMERLGTLADYDHPYVTMDPAYEASVLEAFASLVAEGLVYRDIKPVHWSIANQTALAEAELEYYEREDTSIYVLFKVTDPEALPAALGVPANSSVSLMIWTTTPWTLPANRAVAVAPEAEYSLYSYELQGERHFTIVAEELASHIFERSDATGCKRVGSVRGSELASARTTYQHPFVEYEGGIVTADYVTLEDGTGLVHTAPGHGAEDYFTGIREGFEIYCPVLGDGTFDDSVPEWLQGVDVWQANELVVNRLRETGQLFHAEPYEHSYPHDWRSKTPTIFRATEQWFIAVDREFGEKEVSLRQRALQATREEIAFVPEWGRLRLEGMLESRPDWCISRQRAWGLPIPAFLNQKDQPLLTAATVKAVAEQVQHNGSNYWFEASPEALLAGYRPEEDPDAPDWLRDGGIEALFSLKKGTDIFDVWFESGSSWNAVLNQKKIGYPADLYLEGSDQHRGWFQLSLLPALGVTGRSPFRSVLTHGFMVDAEGRKMSKSTGNAIQVEDVLKEHGVDVCRWWVSSLNYSNDIKVDWEFFQIASEEYRKIRNTIRFLLGNLQDFDPSTDRYILTEEDRYSVDAWAMGQLASLVASVRDSYEKYHFKGVSEATFNFCNDAMSAVYLTAVKDRLYCDEKSGTRRRRTQTVLYDIASALVRVLAPIMVHTSEEAWLALKGLGMESHESVHLNYLPEKIAWEEAPEWVDVMDLRREVMKAFEDVRERMDGLKNPLDAGVVAVVPAASFDRIQPFESELADLCGMSRFRLEEGSRLSVEIEDLREEPRCERSWKRDGTVRERSDGSLLSDRDAQVLGV